MPEVLVGLVSVTPLIVPPDPGVVNPVILLVAAAVQANVVPFKLADKTTELNADSLQIDWAVGAVSTGISRTDIV